MEKEATRLEQQINEFGSTVGFVFEGPAGPIAKANPPQGTLIWTNSFAVIAVVPLSDSNPDIVKSTAHDAQDWLDLRIIIDEERAVFLDGYLLVALTAEPKSDELRSAVSEIELDTSVCRKHAIWPTAEGDWGRKLWAVTCLGLPMIQVSTPERLVMPTLLGAASRSLRYYEAEKNYEAVAEKLIEEAISAAKKTIKDAS